MQTPAKGESGKSAKETALAYLYEAGVNLHLLPINHDDWQHLSETIHTDGPTRAAGFRFRWVAPRELKRNTALETSIVWVQQTAPLQDSDFVPDVLGGSIRMVVHHHGAIPQITSARSTTIENAELSIAPEFIERTFHRRDLDPSWADILPRELTEGLLAASLGLTDDKAGIGDARLAAYPLRKRSAAYGGTLGLAVSTTAFLSVAGEEIAHRVLLDPFEDRLVRKAPIASACAGYAFLSDPDSKTGAFELRPDSGADLLDPERDPVALLDLDHVPSGRRKLSGPRVQVLTPAALGSDYDPPVQRPPFSFSSRTNKFAAVSAYCHCDSMMLLVEQFGFKIADYFAKIRRPLVVEHRAKMLAGSGARDGRGINAYVTPFRAEPVGPPWDARMLFGLADFADTWRNPLGLVADVRFVWHEFCHVMILAATGSTEFDFAHSAGDALAAIMDDPSSKLNKRNDDPCRGVTFPFIQLPLRRHDRRVEDGWGWNGTQYERPNPTYGLRDPAGYNAEQILSSTLFRLYCALGGDALRTNAEGNPEPDIERRRAAAYYCAYLIVNAIGSLGCVETEPTIEASQFATALMEADVGTSEVDDDGTPRLGGMVHKVVRWAFERQGLYQILSNSPRNEPGRPPAVDIFVDDNRAGSYGYSNSGWHALPGALWVRQNPDGGTADEPPTTSGQTNYVYVILRNRGDDAAMAASVDVFAATGPQADTWLPQAGYWLKLPGNNGPQTVPSGGSYTFGPFEWTPQAGIRNALLVRTSVDGDHSNIDDDSPLRCATGPTPVEYLVRSDNNLGYREWRLP
ncbi:hypothetical protein JQ607_35275 [Bradyrhizobium liaoningense]|uniref:hypothetical protein n=1 Tax=Bradyrhizobium liaoningense TaxID=43992 RepID=UPI001BA732C0|nr:hypothetical protein [Bradyrhizobium liaoningense]MBR0845480.1 hypothetical protein [Bradyrhizobium liaoningense]